jgi:hypothetical protein
MKLTISIVRSTLRCKVQKETKELQDGDNEGPKGDGTKRERGCSYECPTSRVVGPALACL